MRKDTKYSLIAGLGLAFLPLTFFGYTSWYVVKTGLPGCHRGPQDAYVQALRGAVITYFTSIEVVHFLNARRDRYRPNSYTKERAMAEHNRLLGASIALSSKQFSDIEARVSQAVASGAIYSSDPNQITWFPKGDWRDCV